MADELVQRLSSVHLEDLAYVALSANVDDGSLVTYPNISDASRSRMRSRIKQLSKYSWPSSMKEDGAFKSGYTLQQCCRLITALLLLDAYVPPSIAVMLAANNELTFLKAIATRLHKPHNSAASPDDLLAVILPGEIRQASDAGIWPDLNPRRVRLIPRGKLEALWAGDLAGGGARLTLDVAIAASAAYQWISGRRLMTNAAREALLDHIQINQGEPGFTLLTTRVQRRP